jgi:two-component system, OmpR family, phosphate regulon sensor histidine kinase PhoR
MPPLDTWMVITLRTPFFAAILVASIFIALIIFTVMTFRRKLRDAKILTQRVEELQTTLESSKAYMPDMSSLQEAYLQFTYNISHEVSNPLQSVQTNLENMADCSPEEIGRWKQYYSIIKQEIKRLFTLTENLRLLSQLERVSEPVKREPVNLKGVIEDVIMAQAERASMKNINLRYQGPNRPAKVFGNREYLYQLIINLVDNSIKYSKDSGGEITTSLNEKDDAVHVIIMDDGIGIPEEDLPFVFDTAYRSLNRGNRTGSGLGLAIVKRIVDQHEGKVRVDSVVGQGTTMTIELPIYNPAYQA